VFFAYFVVIPMSLIDTHAHLDDEQFDADRDAVVARAEAADVEAIVCVGVSADSSAAVVRLAERHKIVFAAVGVQPNSCAEAAPDDWDRVVAMTEHPRVVALGETGLDRYWDFTPFEIQQDYFDRHLRLSQERDLPVLIHCRDSEDDVLAMLREATGRGPIRGLVHAFSGGAAMADECVAMGLFLSFAGMVSYTNKKFAPLRAVAAGAPADRLLLETDSPYLVPHPLRGKLQRNEPANLVHTAASLAQLRGATLTELSRETTVNARRLFQLS
jgi:TatD DNase family protein